MAGRRRQGRGPDRATRTARVGELIRRIVAEEMESLDDERLELVSITSVDVDPELHRAVVWFTTFDADEDPDVLDALEEHRGRLRRAVSRQTRLRRTPELWFRPDTVLRSAARIEDLLRNPEPGDGDDG